MRTVSVRLTLLLSALFAAVLVPLAASLYLWIREDLDRTFERELQTRLAIFQTRFLEEYGELLRGEQASLDEPLREFLTAAGATGHARRADGTLLFGTPGRPEGYRERSLPVAAPDGRSFTLALALDHAPVERSLAAFRGFLWIFLPAFLVLSAILGSFFVRRALEPVETIRRQAERISRASLSERLPEPALPGEFRDLARTFNEMLDRLERAFQDLQSFAADAAHELRTPLANLRAEIETAVQARRSPEEVETMLGSFSEEIGRMSRIVGDLLTLARMDLGRLALQKERVPLFPVLEEVRETWQAAAAERRIQIRVEGPGAEVDGDPAALRRVFMNLVENAVRYNRDEGRIVLSLEREHGRVRVRVRDTGRGISAEHLPRLFRRFYRADAHRSRDTGGSGLGLAICKSFVEAHEGAITVKSVLGSGTEFTVDLPEAASVKESS